MTDRPLVPEENLPASVRRESSGERSASTAWISEETWRELLDLRGEAPRLRERLKRAEAVVEAARRACGAGNMFSTWLVFWHRLTEALEAYDGKQKRGTPEPE